MSFEKKGSLIDEISKIIEVSPLDIETYMVDSETGKRRIILANDTLIRGVLFKANTEVTFHDGSWLVKKGTLARDTRMEVKYNLWTFKNESVIEFHDNGEVRRAQNSYEGGIVLPKIKVKAGWVNFYPNGHLSSAQNVESFGIGNYKVKPGYVVFYDPGVKDISSVMTCSFTEITRWGEFEANYVDKNSSPMSVSFARGSSIDNPGNIIEFLPAFETLINGVFCSTNQPISLYESQALKYCKLAQDQVIQDVDLIGDKTYLEFYESGRINSILSAHPVTINGKVYREWKKIYLTESGDVQTTQN